MRIRFKKLREMVSDVMNEDVFRTSDAMSLIEPRALDREDGTGSDQFNVGDTFVYVRSDGPFDIIRTVKSPMRYAVPPAVLQKAFIKSNQKKPAPSNIRGVRRA